MANVMFASKGCGGCESAIKVLDMDPRWKAAVEVRWVNDPAVSAQAAALGIGGVPTLVMDIGTPDAQQYIGAQKILGVLGTRYPSPRPV